MTGIIELDVHGMKIEEAKRAVDHQLQSAAKSVYRIRVIHGFHGGTGIKRMLQEEYGFCREPRVLRVVPGGNQGITELVLREY